MVLYAEKGNKVKEIDESQIEACVQQGYKVVDAHGRLIQDTIPTDKETLTLAYKQNAETIKSLKAENQSLKATNETLTAEIANLKKELEEVKASHTASSQSATTSKGKFKKSETKAEE